MVKAIGHFVGETRKMWSRRPRLLMHRLESLCHQRTAEGGGFHRLEGLCRCAPVLPSKDGFNPGRN